MPPRFAGLWLHADFRRLWAGQTISVFGTLAAGGALTYTAILWLHATAAQISILAACQLIPGFAVGLIAGVWVDRLRRRPVMIATDVARAATLASIPIAAVFDVLTLPHLYVVAMVISTLTVFFDTAYQSYLPTLIPRESLVEGNSKLTASASVVEVVGFSISGWLLQLLRAPGAVAVDAVSFVFSALFVSRIRTAEPPPKPAHERTSVVREAIAGARVVFGHPYLRTFAAVGLVQSFATQMLTVVYLLYLVDEVGFQPGVLGMIFAIGGATSLGGAWLATRDHWFGGLGNAIVAGAVFRALGSFLMPLAADTGWLSVSLLIANQMVVDPFWTIFNIHEVTLKQAVTPEEVQGRMFANMRFLDFGGALLGAATAGVVAEAIGVRETLFLSCGVATLASLVVVLSPLARLTAMPVLLQEAGG